jgi:hypothetical protein
VEESHTPLLFEGTFLSVELGNPSVIVGRIFPQPYSNEQKTRVNGKGRAWPEMSNLAYKTGNVFFMSKEVFLWFALSAEPLMLGRQTGNSWRTLRISCHINLIHLSLVSFDPCKSSSAPVWMLDFQANSISMSV